MSAYSAKELKTAMDKAKIRIMFERNVTFISTILFSLKASFNENLPIPTAATDGENLFLDPDFFMGLTEPARIGLLLHETWHVCFNHMFRGRDLDQKRYNAAADYLINLMIKDSGFELPPKGLYDKKYRDMALMDIYDDLEEEFKKNQNAPKYDNSQDIIYSPQGKPSPAEKVKQAKRAHTLLKAKQRSQLAGDSPGSIPGDIERMLEELFNPKVPWTTQLQRYITGFIREGSSYRRPNRRYLPDFYLPSPYTQALTDVCVAIDTSGSVRAKEFKAFISEIHSIKETLQPEKLTVLDFDTEIKEEHVLEPFDDISHIKFHGGGGTQIQPVMNWARTKQPAVMIVFSDMYFDMQESFNPGCPVLWISVNNTNHKHLVFGDVIDYSTKDL